MAPDVQAQVQLSAVRSEREALLTTRMELQSLLERAQMEASRARRQQQAAEVRNRGSDTLTSVVALNVTLLAEALTASSQGDGMICTWTARPAH